LLSKGGLGEVFVALDVELHREVAVKEIQARHLGRGDFLGRFLLEAEVTGKLEHPGVVPVYGLGSHPDGRPYYAMRLIKGQSLQTAIDHFHAGDRAGREPGERVLAFRALLRRFIDVCNTIGYAHSKGVLHRDLKPENVMLGNYGETLVIDWGLAKVLGRPENASAAPGSLVQASYTGLVGETGLIGTPGFMAPEQIQQREEEIGPASDIYGLGAILYALVAGARPLAGPLDFVLAMTTTGQFARPRQVKPEVPPALEAVVLKAMALRPEDRYTSAKELAEEVEHWLADEPVSAYREPLSARVRRWGRRHRTLMGSLAVFLVALTAVLGVGLVLINAEQARTRRALADKEIEAARALAEAERAERAELERRIELAHTSASAARLAAQRGQWKEALAHYQKAIELGPRDDVALWLGVLECRLAMGQYRAFRDDLARLEARSDLGEHAGEVRLMRALIGPHRAATTAELIAAIEAAVKLGLPPAEKAYAQGLLAPDVPTAITHLQEATRLDPHHRRSFTALAGHLFLSGRTKEMREAITRLETVSPASGSCIGLRALLLTLDGDLEAARRHCERLRPVAGDEGVLLTQSLVRVVAWLTEDNYWETDPVVRVRMMADFYALISGLAKLMETPDAIGSLGEFEITCLPASRSLRDNPLVKGASVAVIMKLVNDSTRMADIAGTWAKNCPNGTFYHIQGAMLWQAQKPVEACTAMRRAMETPALGSVARKARFDLMQMLIQRARTAPFPARGPLQDEACEHLRDLARSGVYPAWAYQTLCSFARELREDALALSLSEAWQQRFPNDVAALRARELAESNLRACTRQMATLKTLLEKDPSDADLVNRRTLAQYRQGAFADATASCFEALRLNPKVPNAAGNLTIIEAELRRRQAIYGVVLEKLRLRAALVLAHQGQHVEAVKAVAEEKPEGDTLPALACLYAVASTA
jgi:tetratricopeptide (TPR) repeat protein